MVKKGELYMDIISIVLLAIGLSMDAFAVSICKGLAMSKLNIRKMFIIALWFGGFQALMPLIGYFLGTRFTNYIETIDHWIAFGLLVIIGANMIREAFGKDENQADDSVAFKSMFILAIATSIDALAIGVTFSFFEVNIVMAVCIIGVITFLLSLLGVKVGKVFGTKYKTKAEIVGGAILILLGIKILLEHLDVLPF